MAETLSDVSILTSQVNLFGKYELGRLLGVGGFAKVFHGRNVGTGQSVAIKAVSKKKVVKENFAAQVKREIAIMRRLRHPNVVKLLEVLATKTKIYFVMEFAKGGELFTRITRGRFSEDLSRRYFQQLITAIGYCHARGVFHRDLKPENLLLDDNWNLKITDFGLSAVKDQVRPDGLLHTLCGTPAYVAPEILGKKGYDGAKVDVWSCGVILYVLIAGYLPFNHTNLMVMYKKIYKGEFRFPKWVSSDLKRFISRLLDINPETRITVDEIVKDPWFKKDYKIANAVFEDLEFKESNKQVLNEKCLNAFDIISFSPGFDLSNLFTGHEGSVQVERFASRATAERIVKRVEEVVKVGEGLFVVKRKEWGLKLQGKNGDFALFVDVYRLTEELVVVEIKEVYREGPELGEETWKDRLRAKLCDLICPPGPSVLGD